MTGKRWVDEWVFENGSYKLVALFITLILWVSVLGRKEISGSKEVALVFNPSSDRIVTSASTWSVTFELSGSKRALKKFLTEPASPIQVNLADKAMGRLVVTVPEDSLKLPFGVRVLAVKPASLVIDVDEIVKKKVPVVIGWRDIDSGGDLAKKAQIEPSEVVLEGSKTALKGIREIVAEVSSEEAILENGVRTIRGKIRPPEMTGIKTQGDWDFKVTF